VIPFNKPLILGEELNLIADSLQSQHLSGDGKYTDRCTNWLKEYSKSSEVLLTHSCTAALEMAAILADIKDGDEVIMPSFTFASTANAFVLRGAIPVFVDIKEDTLNINELEIERAITERTKAIVVVHYAGGSCNMEAILNLARLHKLIVIEDAAQALGSTYYNSPLGTLGDFGCFSFHETKNVSSGEGGAIFINNKKMIKRARIIREKGTNRHQFLNGLADKYTWVDVGSSYLPNEITAAFLYAQLIKTHTISKKRLEIWERYNTELASAKTGRAWITPSFEDGAKHNAHIFHIRLRSRENRDAFIQHMRNHGVQCAFHYIPLHTSPFGKMIGRFIGSLDITTKTADTLVRMPMWIGVEPHLTSIIRATLEFDCLAKIKK